MYYLWESNKISKPSDYWNMDIGDKIVLKAFAEYEVLRKAERRNNLIGNQIPIFTVDVI